MSNPYAPPQSDVRDVADPQASSSLAGRGTRLIASILDSLIAGACIYIPLLLGSLLFGSALTVAQPSAPDDVAIGAVLMLLAPSALGAIVWAVATYRSVRDNGQTLGKKIMSIKVVRTNGLPISLGRIFWLRNVVNGLLSFIPLYAVIDGLFIFSDDHRCLHDRLADTIVINA